MSVHKGLRAKIQGRGRIIGIGAAAAGVLALVVTGAAVGDLPGKGSVNSGDIQEGQVRSNDIKNGGVWSPDIHDGSVRGSDLSDGLKNRMDKIQTMSRLSAPTPVVDVGGTFGKFTETVRATQLQSFTLKPGRWVIDADGFFMTNVADPARDVRMQLALRVNDGTDWGLDFGTAFTGPLSPLANREATVHTTRVVKVTEPVEVLVYAFGYEDDQGSAASGQVDASSYVTAQRVAQAQVSPAG